MESNLFIFKTHGTQALPLDDTVWSQLTTIITIQIILFYTKFVCVCSYWPSHCQHFSSNSQFLWLSLYWLAHENPQQNHHDFVFVGESTHTHNVSFTQKAKLPQQSVMCVIMIIGEGNEWKGKSTINKRKFNRTGKSTNETCKPKIIRLPS